MSQMSQISQVWQFVQNHLALWLAFVAILSALLFEELKRKFKPSNSLLPQEAVKLINHSHAVVVDIRDSKMFKDGHIVDAINIPKADFAKSTPHKLNAYKNKVLLLVGVTEHETQKIATQLKADGFDKLYVLADGSSAWQNANLPLVKR